MDKKTAEGELLNDNASNYDKDAYEKPSVTVDIAICTVFEEKLWVRLIKRSRAPYRGCWVIPGGFVDVQKKESLEKTAQRELLEETGIKDIYLEQLKTYGNPERDPRMRIITVAYFALVPYDILKAKEIFETSEEGDLQWFPLRKLPQKIGFDHRKILKDLIVRLEGKVCYTPIAFSLVAKRFTWTDLQTVYEAILGHPLISCNFRRKIRSIYKIKKTGSRRKGPGRPSGYLVYKGPKDKGF